MSMLHSMLILIMGSIIGAVAAYLGSLMLSKRMALVGGALGHLALPGIALAIIYQIDISLGALFFLIIGISIIWGLEQRTKLPLEALTAVVFAISLACAFLLLPIEQAEQALVGEITKVTPLMALFAIILACAIWYLTYSIMADIVLMSISEDLASVEKIPCNKRKFLYLAGIALIIALGVRIIGGLMTAALIAIPACTARNMCLSLRGYTWLSFLNGFLSCFIGILISFWFAIASGPAIIITSGVLFLLSVIGKRSHVHG